jgi:KTSC domain
VQPEVYKELMAAASLGTYFVQNIKDEYATRKIA